MDRITAPPELVEDTRRMLRTGLTRRRTILVIRGVGAIAAALVIIVGLFIWMETGGYLTRPDSDNRVNGAVVSHPEDEDVILFVLLTPEDLTPPVRLSPSYPLRRNYPLGGTHDPLPAGVPDGLSHPAGSITAYYSSPSDVPDAITGRALYPEANGGSFNVVFVSDPTLLYLPIEIGGSIIESVTVGLGFLEAEEKYLGAFQKDGFTYLVTTENIPQTAFIDLMRYFVKGK